MIAIHEPTDWRARDSQERVAELKSLWKKIDDLRQQVWDRDDLILRLNARIADLAAQERLLQLQIKQAKAQVRDLANRNAVLEAMAPQYSSEE